MTTVYFAEYAWLPGGLATGVRVAVTDGRIASVDATVPKEPDDVVLRGVVLPGFANTHSHAFHRALRGRTHDAGGTFWTWRERMYEIAARLDPDSYLRLARAVFAEMALAGVTCVGEFHYLHHGPGGRPYDDPNAMGRAVLRAAEEAGIRITLLDTCYLAGGLGPDGPLPPDEVQQRYSDGDAARWAERRAMLVDPATAHARIGAAVHSVRAVPRDQLATVAEAARGAPLHVHVSEQPAENEQCLAAYGSTPVRVLRDSGVLGRATTAVHATHLSDEDVEDLSSSGTTISMCPTTERDLADGVGPARRLREAGCPVVLGSDQNAVVDMFEEARGLEMDERLVTLRRGRFRPGELLEALTVAGHRSLGWDDAGRIEPGARADLVAVRLDTVRSAGTHPEQIAFSATAADVDTVVADGRVIVDAGRHRLGDVGQLLADAL